MVEVGHLLTAIVDPVTDATGQAFLSAGLTSEAIRRARNDEYRSAPVIVGVQTSQPSPTAICSESRSVTGDILTRFRWSR